VLAQAQAPPRGAGAQVRLSSWHSAAACGGGRIQQPPHAPTATQIPFPFGTTARKYRELQHKSTFPLARRHESTENSQPAARSSVPIWLPITCREESWSGILAQARSRTIGETLEICQHTVAEDEKNHILIHYPSCRQPTLPTRDVAAAAGVAI
jgi:hypothetical protein